MNSRPLTGQESRTLRSLNAAGCQTALLFLTETGLRKSILDATEPMRRLLAAEGVHNYSEQRQGKAHKATLPVTMVLDDRLDDQTASLYRPVTKKGDPRIWLTSLRSMARPGDVCAVFVHGGRLHAVNLSISRLADDIARGSASPGAGLIGAIHEENSQPARELLRRLQTVAREPLRSVCQGDTAIGRTVETALGIPMNSSQQPDFRGIEIKARRMGQRCPTRSTLFACVPDWKISHCKSMREILDAFGYIRDGRLVLHCTVSALRANSQGLLLRMDDKNGKLDEDSTLGEIPHVCAWRLETLHRHLCDKHRETFWVDAEVERRDGVEWFTLVSATHTHGPSTLQFDRLLDDGSVTVDHLVTKNTSGQVREKGPLFKIGRGRVPELFMGEPTCHPLRG